MSRLPKTIAQDLGPGSPLQRALADAGISSKLGRSLRFEDALQQSALKKALGLTSAFRDDRLSQIVDFAARGSVGRRLTDGVFLSSGHFGLERLARLDRLAESLRPRDIDKLLGGQRPAGVDTILQQSKMLRDALRPLSEVLAKSRLDGSLSSSAERASLKLSLFSGGLDFAKPNAGFTKDAFGMLFGRWETHPRLPARFFRDEAYRKELYREADVDPWLIEADTPSALEVLVDSGTVERGRTSAGVSAVLSVGDVTIEISAGRVRSRTRDVIDAFEGRLREFVAAKLEALAAGEGGEPGKWFVRRVPHDIVKRAKEMRREAMKAQEASQPLIHYTNIGDLLQVVLRSDNWRDVFAPVFLDADAFKVDIQRINANRRPASHTRPVDPPRLVETVLVVRRLLAMMDSDGVLLSGWDNDC